MESITSNLTIIRKAGLIFLFAFLLAVASIAAPNVVSITYNSINQSEIVVEFNEDMTVTEWNGAIHWRVYIGGLPVGGVAGVTGPWVDPANPKTVTLYMPSAIDFSDVQAGVTVEYMGTDGTAAGTSGPLAAFGPDPAVNDIDIDCSMLTGVQGISVDNLSGSCSPVTLTLGFFWEWSAQARNSINFDASAVYARMYWNDPSNVRENFHLTETSVGSGIFTGSGSFTYPVDGTECVYEPYVFPQHLGAGASYIACQGGSAQQSQALTNWNTDAIATGELHLEPVLTEVCLGQSFTEIKSDNTLFNCRKDIEPNKPNIGPRDVQFIYGTGAGRQIPNVYVGATQITDAAGNNLFPGGYVDPTIHHYDSGAPPFPNAVTINMDHVGDVVNDQVGDQFEITLRNWGPCNPGPNPNNAVLTTAIIEIVDGPLAEAGPDQSICEGSNAIVHGSISNTATTASWSTGGDGSFSGAYNNATYTPGGGDESSGSVWLYLTTDAVGGCPVYVDSLLLTIDPAATNADAGSDAVLCGSSYVLDGNALGGGGEWGQWTVILSSGTPTFANAGVRNTTVNNLGYGDNRLRWTHFLGGIPCMDSDDVIITRDRQPTAANVTTADQDLCNTASLALNANAATFGGTGTWSVVSNSFWLEDFDLADNLTSDGAPTSWVSTNGGGFARTLNKRFEAYNTDGAATWTGTIDITGRTDIAIGADLHSWGTNTFENSDYMRIEWQIDGGGYTQVYNQTAAVDGSTGGSSLSFKTRSVVFDIPGTGTTLNIRITLRNTVAGEHYAIDNVYVGDGFTSGVPAFTNGSSNNPTVSNLQQGVNTFRWTLRSEYGLCTDTYDEVTIRRDLQPTAANAGGDQHECNTNSYTMAANIADNGGSGWWTGPGGVTYVNQDDPVTVVSNIPFGANTFTWTISSELGICADTDDDVIITRWEPPTAANAGGDQDICGSPYQSNAMGANAASVGLGTWTRVNGPGNITNFSLGPNNENTQITVDAPGTYLFRWTIVNGDCSTQDDVQVIYRATPTTANAGADDLLCGTTYHLDGNVAVSGNGTWTIITAPGGITLADPSDEKSWVSLVAPYTYGNYTLRWTISTGPACFTQDDVTIQFTMGAEATANPVADQCMDAGSLANVPVSGTVGGASTQGGWEVVTGLGSMQTGGDQPAGVINDNYVPVAGDIGNTIELRLRANSPGGGCQNEYSNITFTIDETPQVISGLDIGRCDAAPFAAIQMTGASASGHYSAATWTGGTGTWSQNNDPGLANYTPDANNGNITATITLTGSGACTGVNPSATRDLEWGQTPVVDAGSDISRCTATPTAPVTMTGASVSGTYTTARWSGGEATGTWSINDASPQLVTYTPNAGETSGSFTATITVTGTGACTGSDATDTRTITWGETPAVDAGSDISRCTATPLDPIAMTGATATGTYTTARWTGGEATGVWTINDASPQLVTYTPNAGETSGNFIATLTVTGTGSCTGTDVTDTRMVTWGESPAVEAGNDISRCDANPANPIVMAGASATGTYTTAQWSGGGGDGTWTQNDASPENATFNPTSTSGSFTATLTVTGTGSCTGSNVTDTRTITWGEQPTVEAGNNISRCDANPTAAITMTGADATGTYTSARWTGGEATGTWTINDANPQLVTYTPNAGETSGSFTATLTVIATGACTGNDVTDTRTITWGESPAADAGSDISRCDDFPTSPIAMTGADASGSYTTARWSGGEATGSWTVNDADPDLATYTPNAGETSGSFTATLTVAGTGSCTGNDDTDTRTITWGESPTADAGNDISRCDLNPTAAIAMTAATATGTYSSADWSGGALLGTWSQDMDPSQATFNPSVQSGTFTATLTVTGTGACSAELEIDTRIISWGQTPVVVAGADIERCDANPTADILMTGATATGSFSNNLWSGGPGSWVQHVDPAQARYQPGAASGSFTAALQLTGKDGCLGNNPTDTRDISWAEQPVADAGSDDAQCGLLYTLAAVPSVGAGQWTLESGPGTVDSWGAGQSVPNTDVTVSDFGTYTFRWTETNIVCSDYDEVDITFIVAPLTPPITGGLTEMCVGTGGQYYSVPLNAGNSYTWLIPASMIIASGGGASDNFVVLNFPVATSDTIEVTEFTPAPGSCPGPVQKLGINVYDPPIVEAGDPVTICQGGSAVLGGSPNGVGAAATGGSGDFTFAWSPSFGLDDSHLEHPTASPIVTTTYTLTVTDNLSGCSDIQDQVIVTIEPLAAVDAGSNGETCEDVDFDLSSLAVNPSGSDYSQVTWTSNDPMGSFDDVNIFTPIYTPGTGTTGFTILTLTADGNAPCGQVQDQMTLTINPKPVFSAGSDETSCEGQPFDLNNSATPPSATNYVSVSWSTYDGIGSFNNPNLFTPTYMPGAGETGVIHFVMAVTGNGSCGVFTDTMELSIAPAPTVDAGSSGEFCGSDPFDLATLTVPPSATNYTSILWTHNGAGSFSDPAVEVPVYIPGAGDNGVITLTMTVTGDAVCSQVADNTGLTINPRPVLDPNLGVTLCSDEATAIILDTDMGSEPAGTYNIISCTTDAGITGSGTTGDGLSITAIFNDAFGNITGAALNVVYEIAPVSLKGCVGDTGTVNLVINSSPMGMDDTDALCSGGTMAYDLQNNVTTLGNGQTATFSWVAIPNASVGGESTTPVSGAVINDVLINTTGLPQSVTYNVTPTGTNLCDGLPFTVTVTVNSEPVGINHNDEICSDGALAYDLQNNVNVLGNTQPATFSWLAADNPNVSGESTVAVASATINDALNNVSGLVQTVVYTVTPTGTNSCVGADFTVTVRVNPEPVGVDDTEATCSDVALAYNLQNNVSILGNNQTATFSWLAADNPNVTGESSSAVSGGIINDIITNVSGGDETVVYTVTPTGTNACAGDDFLITVTVRSEPVGSDQADNTCSGIALAYDLQNNVTSLGNGQAATFTWSAASNTNVNGESLSSQSGSVINDVLTNLTGLPETVIYTVTPVGANSCAGDPFTITITVDPEPVGVNHTDAICSDELLAYDLQNNVNILGNGQLATFSWLAADNPNVSGESTVAVASATINDALINVSGFVQTVVYTVTPTGTNSCVGADFTITVTVNSKPVGADDTDATCSGQALAYNLQNNVNTLGNGQAATYSWVAADNANVTGESTTAQAGGTISDVLINLTGAPETVVYTVTPTGSNSCVGDPFTITITVDPEPVGAAETISTCSDQALAYDLQNNVNTLGNGQTATFTWVAASNTNVSGESLVAQPGVIINDVLTNLTGSVETVIYTVTPTGMNTCAGAQFTITVNVDPEPVGVNDNDNTCSNIALAYDLQNNLTTLGNGQTADFSWLAADNANVTGESLVAVATGTITDVLVNHSSSPQAVIYTVTPTGNPNGCVGDDFTVTVTVNPEPVGVNDIDGTCSGQALAYDLQFNVNTLGNGENSTFSWQAAPNANVAGESTAAQAGAVINDILTNISGSAQIVVYTVTPTGSTGCVGSDFTISVTVDPEPVGVDDTDGTCSDQALAYDLQNNVNTLGNGQAATFTWLAADNANVSGESTAPVAGATIDDVLINLGGADETVVYTVTPVSNPGGCTGDPFTITVTVNPEPVGADDGTSTCSDAALAYDLQNNITTLGNAQTADFSWVAADNVNVTGESLVAVATGTITDVLTNLSGSPEVVIYTVTPTGNPNGCTGDPFTVTVTVDPEPVGAADTDNACSDEALAYDLQNNVNMLGNGLAATFSWVAADNVNVSGESLVAQSGASIDDMITNITNTDQLVVYTVTPTGTNGCPGDPFTVSITVSPEPVGVNDTESACSDQALAYDLQNNVNTLGNNLPATFIWSAADNFNVSGESLAPVAGSVIDDALTNISGVPQTVVYTVTPASNPGGCDGNSFTVTVTVDPEPLGVNESEITCSDVALSYDLQTNINNLGNGVSSSFVWRASADNPNVSGESLTDVAGGTINDLLVNLTGADEQLTYWVIPVSNPGLCTGDTFNITVTVNSEPVGVNDTEGACSNEQLAYDLQNNITTLGNGLTSTFMWVAADNPNLSGESTGPRFTNTINDVITNTTGATETVIYTVTPTGTKLCVGKPFTISVDVDPEPILASNLNTVICSDVETGLMLDVEAGSVAADHYNLLSIDVGAGLVAGAANVSPGVNMANDSLSRDVFTNMTAGPILVMYEVVPVSADDCEGEAKVIMLQVNPEPILNPNLDAIVCSDAPAGITLSVAAGSYPAASYELVAVDPDPVLIAGPANALPAAGLPIPAISADVFTNLSANQMDVIYTIIPMSNAGCSGDTAFITLSVNPEPVLLADLDTTVCSNSTSGILLDEEVGSVDALDYNLTNIQVAAGLYGTAGNATVGIMKPATVLINDAFTNITAAPLDVIYTVVPVSAGDCPGDPVDIIFTINPKPVLDPGLNATVCSGETSGITLGVTGTSVAAASYDIIAINVQGGLTQTGTATIGAGQADNAIAFDAYENLSSGPLQVTYDVVPVSADGCEGDLLTITLTVSPEPILLPESPTVCSGEGTGIVFTVAGGSTMAMNYNVVSFTPDPALVADAGNTVTAAADGLMSNAIIADKFVNTTNAALYVDYEVAPVSLGSCIGDTVLYSVMVNPEPVLRADLDTTVCSDAANGILLDVIPASVGAATYTINSINAEFGLIANGPVAGPGPLQPATAISADIYTNNTAGALTVTFNVVPVSTGGGCNGQPVDVVVSINPEPILANGLNTTVCSDEETGVVFDVRAGGASAVAYNITGFLMDPGLTADAANLVSGISMAVADNAIQTDKFTNLTAFPLTVVYDVVPVSADGCEGKMSQLTVVVNPEPILTPGLGQELCSGTATSLQLSVQNGVSGITYNWDAPTNTGGMTGGTAGPSAYITDTFDNQTVTAQTATYYVVPVSGMGCAGDTVPVVITVNPNPSADINGGMDPIPVCGGIDLILDGMPAGGTGNYTHQWSGQVGGLDNISTQTPVFNSVFSADYSLTYTVTDDKGCKGSDQVIVSVNAPRALYSMDQNTGCTSFDVAFTNNSTDADAYAWDFGDGSAEDNTTGPTHTFTNAGSVIEYFNVKLTAESAGCYDSITQVVSVYPSTPAGFQILPDTICHGDAPVQIVALPGAATYYWDFGDGNAGYASDQTTHSFSNTTTDILTRTVSLTTESFYGCVETATEDIVIYPMPVPDFTANPSVQTWPDNHVDFTDNTNTGTWSYLWDFDDGNSSTASDPGNDYLAPGLYQVRMEVSNDRCSDYVVKTVEIKPISPVAEFEDVPPACNEYTVTFSNISQNATSYLWDFGDGNTDNTESPTHTFYYAGEYNVILTAYGPGGQDQYFQMLTVYQTPAAYLTVAPDKVYVNDRPVQCFNQSSYGDTWLWDFGDGDTDTVFQPSHVYREEGVYDVSLTAYTNDGCEDIFILNPAVTVEPAGDLRFATAFKPNPNGPSGGHIPDDPNLVNTVFYPPIKQQIDNYHLEIYNRWGEKMFESDDINIGWDGYYKEKICKQDVYVWQVTGNYSNGSPYRQAGDITLLH